MRSAPPRPAVSFGYTGDVRRRIFTLASAVSLVLCFAVAVLWVSSRFRTVELYAGTGRRTMWNFDSSAGEFAISHYRAWPGSQRLRLHSGPHLNWATGVPSNASLGPVYALNVVGGTHTQSWWWWQFHGSAGACRVVMTADDEVEWDAPVARLHSMESNRYSGVMPFWTVIGPYWLLATAFALLPAGSVARWGWSLFLRLLRRRPGCCRRCGYDLTGNTSGICPECGAAVVRSTPATPANA